MSIFKRGKFWWIDITVDGKRKRFSLGVTTQAAAKIKEAELLKARELRDAGFETHLETRVSEVETLIDEFLGVLAMALGNGMFVCRAPTM